MEVRRRRGKTEGLWTFQLGFLKVRGKVDVGRLKVLIEDEGRKVEDGLEVLLLASLRGREGKLYGEMKVRGWTRTGGISLSTAQCVSLASFDFSLTPIKISSCPFICIIRGGCSFLERCITCSYSYSYSPTLIRNPSTPSSRCDCNCNSG